MPTMSYAVVRSGDEWRILTARRLLGHYGSADQALSVGARLARQAANAGHAVELLVENPAGLLVPQSAAYSSVPEENRTFI